ncbi:hypothetical protein BCR44DRAFT_1029971 [Catenaria anguillulae PL171]|uniref:Cytochrome P450 n=1 Tax=Catenaria anguillulae PL171 TaxID=765915 RepID=A0A1Y2H662_9FUNG|nr:hypothetical protein BCR44DRAFT_1029971 [Catenaria anguillulae PL171]
MGHVVLWRMGSHGGKPDGYEDLLTEHQTYEKFDFAEQGMDYGSEWFGKTSIVFSKTEQWKRHRRSINPSFRRGWSTDLFAVPGHALLAKLDTHAASNDPIPIADYMQRITLDALSLGAFGHNLDSINNPHSDVVTLYHRLIAVTTDATQMFLASPLIRWAVPRQRQYLKDARV